MNKFPLILAAAIAGFATSAQAETTECTEIAALPATIALPGVYCFKKNLVTGSTSGSAITINSNNVSIDMNGFKLGGASAGPTTLATGISANNRKNITLRNGSILGFFTGVSLGQSVADTSSGHLLEDLLIDRSIVTGISVIGTGIVIRNNRVVNTSHTNSAPASASGTPTIPFSDGANSGGYGNADHGGGVSSGITGIVAESVITNNVISSLSTDDEQAAGIYIFDSTTNLLSNNYVANVTASLNAFGIVDFNGTDNTISDNLIIGGNSPTSWGVFGTGATRLICAENTVGNFGTAVTGCTTVSGNLTP